MEAIIDRSRLDEVIAEDPELLAHMIRALKEEAPLRIRVIRDAIEKRDAASLASAAHRLCGSVGCFYAMGCASAASALDALGRGGDLTGAPQALAHLEQELDKLWNALALLRRELSL